MSISRLKICYLLSLCVLLWDRSITAVAEPGPILRSDVQTVDSTELTEVSAPLHIQQVAFLEDTRGELSVEEVLGDPWSDRFVAHTGSIRSFGFTSSAIWGRIDLNASGSTEAVVQLSTTRLDHVAWYEIRDGQVVRVLENGWLDGRLENPAPRQHPSISVRLAKNESCTVLFRVISECSVTLPLFIADGAKFAETSALRLYSSHLQVGASFASVVLCLLLALSLRDWGFALLTFCCAVGVSYGLLFDTVLSLPGISVPRWYSRLGCSLATTCAVMSMLAFCVSYNGWQLLSKRDRHLAVGLTVASIIFLMLQFLIPPRVTHSALGYYVCVSESFCMWLFSSPWRRHRRREDLFIAVGVFVIHLPALLMVLQFEDVLPTYIAPQNLRFVMTPTVVCGLICAMLRKRHFTEQLKVRVAQAKAGEADARLAALRYQLNPHMLLNSLTAVSSLSRSQPERVPHLIDSLAMLLQSRLKPAPGEIWTLAEELELLRSLVDLERARFDDRLSWTECIDPATESCLIPDMLLQPIVENALKYGRHGAEVPDVRIEAKIAEKQLRLRITNSGIFDSPKVSRGLGIGMANIRNRLELLFGPAAKFHFHISSQQAVAEIQLPLQQPV